MTIDKTIFKDNEIKTMTLTMRLTQRQKICAQELAQQKNMSVSRLLLNLVATEYTRQINENETRIVLE